MQRRRRFGLLCRVSEPCIVFFAVMLTSGFLPVPNKLCLSALSGRSVRLHGPDIVVQRWRRTAPYYANDNSFAPKRLVYREKLACLTLRQRAALVFCRRTSAVLIERRSDDWNCPASQLENRTFCASYFQSSPKVDVSLQC